MKDIAVYDEKIKRHRKVLVISFASWFVINGLAMFPVTWQRLFSLSTSILFLMVFYMAIRTGQICHVIYDGDYEKTMFLAFTFNLCGFVGRMLLEYGESTFMGDLTLTNVMVYLLVVPLLVQIGVYIEKRKRRQV